MIIEKNRYGRSGVIRLKAEPEIAHVYEIEGRVDDE
jgi:hypothetical protein